MNQKKPYEITITRKLELLPLPDLQDSIWNRIKTQLDTDMPTDDGPDAPDSPTNPDWPNLLHKAGPLVVIVAAVASLLILSKKQHQPVAAPAGKPAVIQQETQPEVVTGEGPPGTEKNIPFPIQVNKPGRQELPGTVPNADSGTVLSPVVIPAPSIVMPDSLQANPMMNPTPPPAEQPKKSRGVTGIADGDYRLVPATDSAGRKKNN